MRTWFGTLNGVGAVLLMAYLNGCGSGGGPSARPEIDAIPDAELRGSAAKALLYEFRARVRSGGAAAAKGALPELLENFEAYTHLPANEHGDTYTQIFEKLKSLDGVLAGSPSKEAVVEVAEEIGKLADTLPGQADDNPRVE